MNNLSNVEAVAKILDQKPYEEWNTICLCSVANVVTTWSQAGQGSVIDEEVLQVILNFKDILDAYNGILSLRR